MRGGPAVPPRPFQATDLLLGERILFQEWPTGERQVQHFAGFLTLTDRRLFMLSVGHSLGGPEVPYYSPSEGLYRVAWLRLIVQTWADPERLGFGERMVTPMSVANYQRFGVQAPGYRTEFLVRDAADWVARVQAATAAAPAL
jgi:hypothetical protein